MLFPEEDGPLLKAWIVKRIENTSDADSDVLAEYVIALLKHDGTQDSIRKLCEQEIPDFLTEEPKAFLDDVFRAIQHRSYVPGAPPPPPASGEPSTRPGGPQPAHADATGAQLGSKKRPFADRGDAAEAGEHDQADQRSYKQPRRGGRRGMDDGRGARAPGFRSATMPSLPLGMPHFDPNNPMEAIMQMQAMGIPFAGLPNLPQPALGPRPPRNQAKWKGRCRDFDTKGYCSRGSTCMYDHGNESIYVPPAPARGEEYDPNDAVMYVPTAHGQANSTLFNSPESARGRGGRRGRGNGGRGSRRGGARAPFSADGPVNDRSKSTIVVENIPEENFSDDQVREFFSQFGNVVSVSMQPYKHLAIVKFDKWAAANDAYRSPTVIFNNRFVKVFWYKEVTEGLPPMAPLNGSGDAISVRESEPEVDMEEFQRKQEEAQRQHQERQSKREELARRKQELEKQQQDLLAKHQAETEQLRARLVEKNGGDGPGPGSSSGTDVLRAQLAALEQEAKILGLDPNASDDGGPPGFRGGFRGRRGFRGRPRGRASFRGQGARHAAYAQYSIDNRPKKLAIHGADFTPPERDEMLRHFLLNLGEFESVETAPSVTHVSFQDRKTAERFYASLHGKELPGVDGKLELSWAGAPPLAPTSGLSDDGAGGDDDDDAKDEAPRPVDMDYEVGDDDAWDEGIR
ncbi:hypothetical protein CDD83_3375 [Cordyceps sp. RAO-2017]|nr:hypothetical protein CDD83_3375 [Cordyceps sp. RAO-2017]